MRVYRGIPDTPLAPLALTIGNFDGLHIAHQRMLKRLVGYARDHAYQVAVLTFEPHSLQTLAPSRAPRRLLSLDHKLRLLADMEVDVVVICRFDRVFSQQRAEDFIHNILIQRLNVRYILTGEDFRFGWRKHGTIDTLRRVNGLTVEVMPVMMRDIPGCGMVRISSSVVRTLVEQGSFAVMPAILGRRFGYTGRVLHGQKLGRTLGCPTANFRAVQRTIISGVFTSIVRGVSSYPWPAISCLGYRPTVTRGHEAVLETHLLDFQGDLYGQRLSVDILHKLRDEKRYASLDELRLVIAEDCRQARCYFTDLNIA